MTLPAAVPTGEKAPVRRPWNALPMIATALLLAACASGTPRLDGSLVGGASRGGACATAARRQLAAELEALSARLKDEPGPGPMQAALRELDRHPPGP